MSLIQVAKMSFLGCVAGLTLRDRVRSSDIRDELIAEPLLLEMYKLGRFGYLIRMPPGCFPVEVFQAETLECTLE